MKKMIYAVILLALGASSVYAAQTSSDTAQACSKLPPDQKNFSMQIADPANKMMFCAKFSAQQRSSAMRRMTPSMTADEAVEREANENSMMTSPPPPSPSTPSQQQSQPRSGGCPIRTQ